jgi:hypothetical protein
VLTPDHRVEVEAVDGGEAVGRGLLLGNGSVIRRGLAFGWYWACCYAAWRVFLDLGGLMSVLRHSCSKCTPSGAGCYERDVV